MDSIDGEHEHEDDQQHRDLEKQAIKFYVYWNNKQSTCICVKQHTVLVFKWYHCFIKTQWNIICIYMYIKTKRFFFTKMISLKPLISSYTTFLIWGTRTKILRGRKHLSSMNTWAGESLSASSGIQNRKITLTYIENVFSFYIQVLALYWDKTGF